MEANFLPKLGASVALCVAGLLAGGCELAMSNGARLERAERALAQGDAAAAIVDLKNVLSSEADNARARLLLARAELSVGDVRAAVFDVGRVDPRRVAPKEFEPVAWRVRLADRKYREVADGLAQPRPGLPESQRRYLHARALAALGSADEARAELEEALRADAGNDEARAALALAQLAAGQSDESLQLLAAGLQQRPDSALLLRAQGEAYARLHRLEDADRVLRRAFDSAKPGADLPGFLLAGGGLCDVLLARGKVEEAAKVASRLRRDAPNAGTTLLVNGRVAAAQKNFPAALEDLQKLLNADPDNVQIRTLVGGVNLELGNLETAAMNLRRALALDAGFLPARQLLAQVQFAQGHPDEASATLDAATTGGKAAPPELMLMQVRAALAVGDRAKAMRILEQLEQQGVPTEAARLDVAAAFIQAGRPERALELLGDPSGNEDRRRDQLRLVALASKDRAAGTRALQEYATAHSGDAAAVRFAALTLASLGQPATSQALLENLAEARPNDPTVLLDLARVQARAGALDSAEDTLGRLAAVKPGVEVHLALAELAAVRGREDEAVRHLEDARAADPKAADPRALLARSYLAGGNLRAARTVADELVALEPRRPEPRLLSASIALQAKDRERAVRDADEAVRISPQFATAWLGKGEVHERLGQTADARAAYRRALSLAPASPLPPASLVRLELAVGNADAALAAARDAQRQPESRVAGLQLEGDVLLRLGRPAVAARAFEQAQAAQPTVPGVLALYRAYAAAGSVDAERVLTDWIGAHPGDVQVRAVLAEHWQQAGKREKAIAEYEAALKWAPQSGLLMNNLAWLYHEKGDGRALALARRAYEIAPRNPAVADTLGSILVASNQQQEGLRLLREAAAGAPGSVDIQYHLAEALSRAGSAAEAKSVAEEALASNPPKEWRDRLEPLARPSG